MTDEALCRLLCDPCLSTAEARGESESAGLVWVGIADTDEEDEEEEGGTIRNFRIVQNEETKGE